MIHTLFIRPELTPDALRKQARKYAMTGGVILRPSENLSDSDIDALAQLFLPLANENNLASGVIECLIGVCTRESTLQSFSNSNHPDLAVKAKARSAVLGQSSVQKSESDLRNVLAENLGSEPDKIERRKAIARGQNLPEDIQGILRNDESAEVRYVFRTTRGES